MYIYLYTYRMTLNKRTQCTFLRLRAKGSQKCCHNVIFPKVTRDFTVGAIDISWLENMANGFWENSARSRCMDREFGEEIEEILKSQEFSKVRKFLQFRKSPKVRISYFIQCSRDLDARIENLANGSVSLVVHIVIEFVIENLANGSVSLVVHIVIEFVIENLANGSVSLVTMAQRHW